jgi:hypothetical protein
MAHHSDSPQPGRHPRLLLVLTSVYGHRLLRHDRRRAHCGQTPLSPVPCRLCVDVEERGTRGERSSSFGGLACGTWGCSWQSRTGAPRLSLVSDSSFWRSCSSGLGTGGPMPIRMRVESRNALTALSNNRILGVSSSFSGRCFQPPERVILTMTEY